MTEFAGVLIILLLVLLRTHSDYKFNKKCKKVSAIIEKPSKKHCHYRLKQTKKR
jgi:hypothetical protein